MRVLFFGRYDPSYSRNTILIRGLQRNHVEILQCTVSPSARFWLFRLLWKYIRMRPSFDIMLVAFPGQEAMFLARFLTQRPIVFDVFTSHYMGYILDRAHFTVHSFHAKYYRFLDYWSCKLATKVLLDTSAHINYFVNEFGLPKDKFIRVFLGADTERFQPQALESREGPLRVLYWGNYIPLQGTQYILRAANLLKKEQIVFVMVGRGQTFNRDFNYAHQARLSNVEFLGRISNEELYTQIKEADLCLGAFGGGVKTDVTIQNKIFESMASQRPVLTARTSALQELFIENVHCFCCNAADEEDLARSILALNSSRDTLIKVAAQGNAYFNDHLTEEKIGYDLFCTMNLLLSK